MSILSNMGPKGRTRSDYEAGRLRSAVLTIASNLTKSSIADMMSVRPPRAEQGQRKQGQYNVQDGLHRQSVSRVTY
jgi:hypothetical protein